MGILEMAYSNIARNIGINRVSFLSIFYKVLIFF